MQASRIECDLAGEIAENVVRCNNKREARNPWGDDRDLHPRRRPGDGADCFPSHLIVIVRLSSDKAHINQFAKGVRIAAVFVFRIFIDLAPR
jgi:hypothetical protein